MMRLLSDMCVKPIPAWIVERGDTFGITLNAISPEPDYLLPCRRCSGCLHDRKQDWITRIELERFVNPVGCFITLTYRDAPDALSKYDVQCFLKRLRHIYRDYGVGDMSKFKYFAVGEYGKQHSRPHYHLIIFGLDFTSPEYEPYVATFDNEGHPIISSRILENYWSHGFVSVGKITPDSVRYCAKYLLKDGDEFALKSRRIGSSFFFDFTDDIRFDDSRRDLCLNGCVSLPGKHGKYYNKPIPKFVERYLRDVDPVLLRQMKKRRMDYVKSHPISADVLREKERYYDNLLKSVKTKIH